MAEVEEIRLYRPGDEHGIIKLFKAIFQREMTLDEWRWKYTGRGNNKVFSSVAVTDAGEIVAHYGGMRHPVTYEGRDVYGLAIGDVMVHPSFRGTKLFKKVAVLVPEEAVRNGVIFGYGFPNERAMLLPEKLGLYEKVEDVFEAGKEVMFHSTADRFLYRFSPLSFEDEKIDSLWEAVKKEMKLAVVRDRGYLQWRYHRHPFFQYELWGIKRRWGTGLLGLAILRKEEERMLIIDFIAPNTMFSALFRKIENYSYRCGKKRLALWFPEYLKNSLTNLGFSVNPSGTCIPRTTHEKTLSRDEMKGIFFYTMGDTDFL